MAFPFAIGKCMDAMTLGGKAKTTAAGAATTAPAAAGAGAAASSAPSSSSSSWSAFFGGRGASEPLPPSSTPPAAPDAAAEALSSMTGREFLLQSFGPDAVPTWLFDLIPPDAAPLAVLSSGLVGVFVLGACATFVRNVAVNLAGERISARCVW